ncbi:MAG: two-component regulator propeller domain-containing protein, partial [Kiritimatiellae bacterium]|nr:two-component regulator propeller domain-containing protein [Kiritimatiellia bacterium]
MTTNAHKRLLVAAWVVMLLPARSALAAKRPVADAYALRLWTVEDRLPGSPVLGLAQAADGYLWLVTRGQLIRFNGVDFAEAGVPEAVKRQTGGLAGVFCGRSRGVWIYGAGGIARYLNGAWQVWPAEAVGGGAGRVLGMVETSDGVIRAYAERGLLEATADSDDISTKFVAKLCPVPPDDRATLGAVTDAAADQAGSVWMTAWNGLVEYSGGKFDDHSMRLPDFLVEAADGVHAGGSGRLWIHGPNGLAYRENDIWTPVGFPENAGIATAMLEVSDGSLWIGNPTGMFRWHDGAWRPIAEQDTPASLSVNALVEGRDGTVWAACDGGLLRARKKTVQTLRSEGAATSGTAYSLWRTPDGGAWAGYKGLAARLTPDDGRLLQTVYLDADVPVSALLQDALGRVWFGTLGGGLFMSHEGRIALVPQSDYSMPVAHTVYTLTEDPEYGVLAGTPQGLMRVNAGGELTKAVIRGAEIVDPVRAVHRDGDGTLWICCERLGILRLDIDGTQRLFGRETGIEGYPRALCRDSKGNLWVGTTVGLFKLGADHVVNLGRQSGVFGGAVLQITEDGFERLWTGTTDGVLCVSIGDLERLAVSGGRDDLTVRMLHLGESDGLPGRRCMGGVGGTRSNAGGKVWFPFENGVAIVDPQKVEFSKVAPATVIERVFVNGRKVADNIEGGAGAMAFGPGARNVVFHLASLAPGAPDSIRFRFRVDGLHTAWSPVQADRVAVFEWLPPGRYTMRVISEAGGKWDTRGAEFSFRVKAFFWQTPWFYLCLAVALAAAVFLIARWMLWHRYQLQMALMKREEALALERARISRDIHDDLGNGLSVVATLSELAQNDLDKGVAHKRLDQIYDVANELARNVDEIVWAVNPANDGWDPFVSYFEQYTEYFLGNSGLRFHFSRPAELTGRPIASKTRHHLLLAVREAVGNVLKHASASQVKIVMRIEGDVLEVRVEDDGVGFELCNSVKVGHDGLGNMAKRMKEAGGTLEIQSVPGQGTSVTFRVGTDSLSLKANRTSEE